MVVAMGIVSFIMVVLIQMVNATSSAWNSGNRRIDAFREARAALNIIERDLVGMQTDWYDYESLENPSEFQNRPGLPVILDKGTEIKGDSFTMEGDVRKANTDALFFISTTADLTTAPSQRSFEDSLLSMVGYYVGYAEDGNSGRKIYKLYRYFKPSEPTFDRLFDYMKQSSVTIEKFLKDSNRNGSDPVISDVHEVLAYNVTDFTVKAYYYDENHKVLAFDYKEAAKPVATETDKADPSYDPSKFAKDGYPNRPDFVEITLGVLGNQTVAKLPKNDPNAWGRTPVNSSLPSDGSGRAISQEARLFTTRIDCR
jgi:uncharacterized protein (TIGR02599 family)